MILKRIELTLVGPDDYPADEGSYEDWAKQERLAAFLFTDHMHIALVQLRQELPEGFDIETEG